MKRYYDIDPLFSQARRLPMEVSIEQVQGFLATSALPAGATKSWFYSLNFYIMLGIITGAIALLTIASWSPQLTSVKATNAKGLALTELHSMDVRITESASEKTPFAFMPTGETTSASKRLTFPLIPHEEKQEVATKTQLEGTLAKTALETKRSFIIDPVADLLLMDDLMLTDFYGGGYSDLPVADSDIAFMITNDTAPEEVARILGEGRKTNVRIANVKLKHKRNGEIKVMKIVFSVPHADSDWKVFRIVELKGFKTYEYGWTVDENGNTIDFWDKLNNKAPSEVPSPEKAFSKVKYFCNN
jgi:hypothetical protein